MSDPAQKSDLECASAPPFSGARAKIPSWLLSLSLHGAIAAAIVATLPDLRGGIVGDPAGDFRKIGIYVGRSGDGTGGVETSAKEAAEPAPLPQTPEAESANAEPSSPVAEIPDQIKSQSVLGPAPPAEKKAEAPTPRPSKSFSPLFGSASASASQRLSGPGQGNGGPRGSLGSTSFFGIWDQGGKFVYVIDCSGSMFSYNAMQAAKKELLISLQSLKRTQQFQIVFYNLNQKWITAPGSVDFRYFAATEINRRLAAHFTAEVQPDNGTDHLQPLKLALQLHPDVLFFLTDAGEPGLSRSELDELRKLNTRHTRLHCVQFAATNESQAMTAPNFLRTLAQENNGDYVYRNVSQFPQAAERRSTVRGAEPAKSSTLPGR